MECEMANCEAEAVVFRPVLGVMRHVCLYHAFVSKQERPTIARPAVPYPDEDFESEHTKYTQRRPKRPR